MNQIYRIKNCPASNFVRIDNQLSESPKFANQFNLRSSVEVIEKAERPRISTRV